MRIVVFIVLVLVVAIGTGLSCSDKMNYNGGEYTEEAYKDFASTVDFSSAMTFKPEFGDLTGDKTVDISDLTKLIDIVRDQPKPIPRKADVDGNCSVNWDDVWYMAYYMFKGGPEPVAPCTNN